jgi:hypothetical protein
MNTTPPPTVISSYPNAPQKPIVRYLTPKTPNQPRKLFVERDVPGAPKKRPHEIENINDHTSAKRALFN